MIRAFIYLLICLFISSSCKKKFEEGPLISFRSAEKRLQEPWEFVKYYENEEDKSPLLSQHEKYKYIHFVDYDGTKEVLLQPNTNYPTLDMGSYSIKKNKLELNYFIDTTDTFVPMCPIFWGKDTTWTWDILKLTNNEMVLRFEYKQKEQRIELSKKK